MWVASWRVTRNLNDPGVTDWEETRISIEGIFSSLLENSLSSSRSRGLYYSRTPKQPDHTWDLRVFSESCIALALTRMPAACCW